MCGRGMLFVPGRKNIFSGVTKLKNLQEQNPSELLPVPENHVNKEAPSKPSLI